MGRLLPHVRRGLRRKQVLSRCSRPLSTVVVGALVTALLPLTFGAPASAATPGANGKLAFVDSNGNVAVRNSSGAGLVTPLTIGGGFSNPTWSPDGTKIAAIQQGVGIVVFPATSFGLPAVVYPNAGARDPAWSPDGTRLAFVLVDSPGVFAVPVDGSSGEELIARTGSDFPAAEPEWSPDGSRIAFVDTFGDDFIAVATVGSGSGYGTGVTVPGCTSPTWSPDGTRIAFRHASGLGFVILGNMNRHRFEGTDGAIEPAWSPDGTTIAFTGAGITTMPVSGGNMTILSGTAGGYQAAWQRVPPTTPTTTTPAAEEAEEFVFKAVADARVEQHHRKNNYGKSSKLRFDGESKKAAWSYVQFKVKGLSGDVERATLRLYVTSGTKAGPEVYETSSHWTESGKGSITWKNRPDTRGRKLDEKAKVSARKWVEYDVTNAIRGNGSVSFVLVGTSKDGMQAKSRQTSKPPQLVISTTRSV